ncbi:hypothetical protein [Allomesorhizobium camelthorni]|uniref:Uncharacterized protein n=1 Tax=Allomesorhizobium camelthorni TaxID=475069 RepID=A0A6G4WM33_9HYPH|nr:hypothetical protein [Mesorhizobium camelthorni]NGO55170.1 hypothetical protein [Mesorhizobium camelthorni]
MMQPAKDRVPGLSVAVATEEPKAAIDNRQEIVDVVDNHVGDLVYGIDPLRFRPGDQCRASAERVAPAHYPGYLAVASDDWDFDRSHRGRRVIVFATMRGPHGNATRPHSNAIALSQHDDVFWANADYRTALRVGQRNPKYFSN